MSGHSKWATIKRAKQATDIKRGKIFSKLAREISVAARKGVADPNLNPVLRAAVEKARSYNMPKENIDRAIGAASTTAALEEAIYEGYGPAGVAFMVKVLTDNRNRTLGEIRRIFESHGGKLGEAGSAAYIFEPVLKSAGSPEGGAPPPEPLFTVPVTDPEVARKVLALAEALDENDDVQEVFSNFDISDELLRVDRGETTAN